MNRGQQDLIEYLQEENRVLRQQMGAERLRFTDVQRRRLAAKARKIGLKGLFEIGTLVTPDTLLRWYRRLIAKKFDSVGNLLPPRFSGGAFVPELATALLLVDIGGVPALLRRGPH